MRIVICTFLLLVAAPAFAANATVERATAGFITPAYQGFVERSRQMNADMETLCSAPTEAALRKSRDDFRLLVEAWSRVELIRFGPVTAENRIDRILFWPDRKGIGLRQVQAALAKEEPDAADPLALARKSVAMQGLGALEFVLFGTESEILAGKALSFRCRYGLAIAGNITAICEAIMAEWQGPDGFATLWANPGPDNALYRNDAESVTDLMEVFIHGLEQIRDVRINGFLGNESAKDNARVAIYRRSEATLLSLKANLDGLRDLFAATDFPALLPSDADWIADSIRFEFANVERALADTGKPAEDVLADPAGRDRLNYLRLVTSSLSEFFATHLAAALGLSAGFSSLDGD